ncbi:hypothetical protein PSPO01_06080 [Paraphaeosphaeria sporulosa]
MCTAESRLSVQHVDQRGSGADASGKLASFNVQRGSSQKASAHRSATALLCSTLLVGRTQSALWVEPHHGRRRGLPVIEVHRRRLHSCDSEGGAGDRTDSLRRRCRMDRIGDRLFDHGLALIREQLPFDGVRRDWLQLAAVLECGKSSSHAVAAPSETPASFTTPCVPASLPKGYILGPPRVRAAQLTPLVLREGT